MWTIKHRLNTKRIYDAVQLMHYQVALDSASTAGNLEGSCKHKKCQQIVIIKGPVCWGEMERHDFAPMFLSAYERTRTF